MTLYDKTGINDLKKILNLRIENHNDITKRKISITDKELEDIINELFIHGVIGIGTNKDKKIVLTHFTKEPNDILGGLHPIIREIESIQF